jgi:hypothetical protein
MALYPHLLQVCSIGVFIEFISASEWMNSCMNTHYIPRSAIRTLSLPRSRSEPWAKPIDRSANYLYFLYRHSLLIMAKETFQQLYNQLPSKDRARWKRMDILLTQSESLVADICTCLSSRKTANNKEIRPRRSG